MAGDAQRFFYEDDLPGTDSLQAIWSVEVIRDSNGHRFHFRKKRFQRGINRKPHLQILTSGHDPDNVSPRALQVPNVYLPSLSKSNHSDS